jgi:hypothetical protein
LMGDTTLFLPFFESQSYLLFQLSRAVNISNCFTSKII